MTLEDVAKAGFADAIIEAIDCITKREGEEYLLYLERVKSSPLTRAVKLLDLKDNTDLFRLPELTTKDLQRIEKYHMAIKYLNTD